MFYVTYTCSLKEGNMFVDENYHINILQPLSIYTCKERENDHACALWDSYTLWTILKKIVQIRIHNERLTRASQRVIGNLRFPNIPQPWRCYCFVALISNIHGVQTILNPEHNHNDFSSRCPDSPLLDHSSPSYWWNQCFAPVQYASCSHTAPHNNNGNSFLLATDIYSPLAAQLDTFSNDWEKPILPIPKDPKTYFMTHYWHF